MKKAILSGGLAAGSRLLPTRELAAELGVSRSTVVTAYEQLHAEGFIEGKVGSGSYVARLRANTSAPAPTRTTVWPSRYAKRLGKVSTAWGIPRTTSLRYNLQYHGPLANPALTSAWSRELARAARYTDPNYPDMQGLPALREAVCCYLARRRGVRATADEVLIVNGSQQALSMVARVLLDEGDTAVIEDPTHHGALSIMAAQGARVVPVRTDGEGLVCGELPATARCVSVTPSHQFPGGSVLSLQRRLDLLEYARAQDCWIVEDDYDGEFRYDVQPLAALRALDTHDRVIYVGTFSKALFPSLRLGYMVLPAALREAFVTAKWLNDFGSSGIEQAALAKFMDSGAFERHLRQVARTLKARRKTLLDGLRACAGERIEVTDSHAGMHEVVWLRDLDHAQCAALIERARERDLHLYPIAPHFANPPPRPGLLLSYASISQSELVEAVRLFGQCLDEFH